MYPYSQLRREEKTHMISTSLVKDKRFLSSFKRIPVNWVDVYLDTECSLWSDKTEEAGAAQGKSHAGWQKQFISASDEPEGDFLT